MRSPGICNSRGTVSFCIGTLCLWRKNNVVHAERNDGSRSFALDACFYLRADKWFPGHAAIESVNYPGRFLRHQQGRLLLHSYSSTTVFEKDASFRILDPRCKKYRSYNYPSHYFGITGSAGSISTTPELWVPIRPGLSGHRGSLSFGSCHDARKYLRHRNNQLYKENYQDSEGYRMDATFTERKRFFDRTTAYVVSTFLAGSFDMVMAVYVWVLTMLLLYIKKMPVFSNNNYVWALAVVLWGLNSYIA